MSYSPTTTMSKGRPWPNLPISKKSWLITAAVAAVVVAIFLTWMLAARGSDTVTTDHSGQFTKGFDGDSAPAVSPATATTRHP